MLRGLGEAIILNISIKGRQLLKGGDKLRDGCYSRKYSTHFPVRIEWDHNLRIFKSTYLILVNLQVVAGS